MVIDLSQRSLPQQYTAVIESKELLTKNIYLVNFRLQNPATLLFLPGQTISLHVGERINRSMSIASAPGDTTHILMVHDVTPMGPGSKWTLAHNVGDTATFMAPLGIFLLDPSPRKKVFIATGTGIAPFRSMLLDIFSNSELRTQHSELVLYWGLRHEEDVYWKKEFEDLTRKHPNFNFKLTLSKAGDAWKGLRGRVTEHVIKEEQQLMESEYYLCGNKEMVKEMEEKLMGAGVPKAQVYKEMYY